MAEILIKIDEEELNVMLNALTLMSGYELCSREKFAEMDNEFAAARFKEHTEKAEKYNNLSLKIIRQRNEDMEKGTEKAEKQA